MRQVSCLDPAGDILHEDHQSRPEIVEMQVSRHFDKEVEVGQVRCGNGTMPKHGRSERRRIRLAFGRVGILHMGLVLQLLIQRRRILSTISFLSPMCLYTSETE